jgi:hypothetical protein
MWKQSAALIVLTMARGRRPDHGDRALTTVMLVVFTPYEIVEC